MERAVAGPRDISALADVVFAIVAEEVPYVFGCFATLDATTGVISWAVKSRPLGVGDEEFAELEYGAPDVNAFGDIAKRRVPVGILSIDTYGRPQECRRHRDFLSPRFGFTDELRAVFRSRAATWGALALYRGAGDESFNETEARSIAEAGPVVADAIQRCLFKAEAPVEKADAVTFSSEGPAVIVVDTSDRVTRSSTSVEDAIDDLGGWEHGSLPTAILAVAARARSETQPVQTRTQGRSGKWLALSATPVSGPAGQRDVVISIEPAHPGELSRVILTAHGLTGREEDVALLVLQGASTQTIAAALHLSPHTVQDHLKAIFSKLHVSSRREMIARLVLS